jgi:alpha-tubulin suppressor-like RCC1 family protein
VILSASHASAGSKHSIVITAQNEVFTWGANQFGQLGHSDFISRDVCGFQRCFAMRMNL